jgi:hypothetical protein
MHDACRHEDRLSFAPPVSQVDALHITTTDATCPPDAHEVQNAYPESTRERFPEAPPKREHAPHPILLQLGLGLLARRYAGAATRLRTSALATRAVQVPFATPVIADHRHAAHDAPGTDTSSSSSS